MDAARPGPPDAGSKWSGPLGAQHKPLCVDAATGVRRSPFRVSPEGFGVLWLDHLRLGDLVGEHLTKVLADLVVHGRRLLLGLGRRRTGEAVL